ncbi:MAG: NAD(P)-dependent oxidoreductase [Oscillospiraceae bacterium]|nr:NAD(P)-dependent oxidoreductase [Oscillospiraceae bacterium]
MRNVLVTGASGLIGKAVCEGLLSHNTAVVGTDNSPCDIEDNPNFKFIRADITNKETIERIITENKVDALVHLACTVDNDFGAVITETEMNISRNFDEFIYKLAFEAEVKKIVMISTSQVYKLVDSREPIREDDALKPVSNYAVMKLESEKEFARELKEHKGTICCICRVAPVYTKNYYENLIVKITDPKDNTNFVYGTGQYGFQFCCVHNLVDFILCFIRSADEPKFTGIYNVSDKNLTTASDIITFMKTNHRLGPVIQKSAIKSSGISSLIRKVARNKEEKENYRYLDWSTFLYNNMLDNNKALKLVSSFRWDIHNTK